MFHLYFFRTQEHQHCIPSDFERESDSWLKFDYIGCYWCFGRFTFRLLIISHSAHKIDTIKIVPICVLFRRRAHVHFQRTRAFKMIITYDRRRCIPLIHAFVLTPLHGPFSQPLHLSVSVYR